MAKPVVLVTRKLPDEIEARLAALFDARLNTADDPWFRDGAEIARRAAEAGAAGVLCAAGDPMNAQTIGALPASVKIVTTFSVGTDHIALDAAKARGIAVTHTPEVLSFATAETAFTLMLMAARRAGEGERMVRAGKWDGWAPTQLMGVTLQGKTLGVLGFGRIGRELAAMARGMQMNIHYHDVQRATPTRTRRDLPRDGRHLPARDRCNLHACPGRRGHAKVAQRHAPREDEARALVVNTGRGPSVDDEALVAALTSGQIRAAGLDVYDGEPRVHPGYMTLENVALLPHLGSATIETRAAMGERCIVNLEALLLKGQNPPHRAA